MFNENENENVRVRVCVRACVWGWSYPVFLVDGVNDFCSRCKRSHISVDGWHLFFLHNVGEESQCLDCDLIHIKHEHMNCMF